MTDSEDLELRHEMQTNIEADEFLAHFGVKGMKWGKHTAGASGGGGGGGIGAKVGAAKAGVKKAYENRSTTAEIKTARANDKAALKDQKAAKKEIRKAGNPADKAKAKEAFEKVKSERLNSDNFRIASKLTTGEKVAAVVLTGNAGYAAIAINVYATRKKDD
jgi:hypothetical protein